MVAAPDRPVAALCGLRVERGRGAEPALGAAPQDGVVREEAREGPEPVDLARETLLFLRIPFYFSARARCMNPLRLDKQMIDRKTKGLALVRLSTSRFGLDLWTSKKS